MSVHEHSASDVDGEGASMIKYLRDKIIGHPAVFSRVEDLPIDDEPIKRSNSQSSLNDGMSTSTISNETTTQVEKLLAAGLSAGNNFGRRPPAPVSSPIIIPKKPPRSNASSQSSSSYTSVADQMSSLGESSMPSDDVSMPTLPPASQRLEHSAARDRISVKNKRRQPVKQRLSTLRETEDNEVDLFASKLEALSSTPDEEPSITTTSHIEHKVLQPLIDLSDLGSTRDRLRKSSRPARDRSADNILLATNTNFTNDTSSLRPTPPPMHSSSVQRSVSFKRPQEMNDANASKPRPILKPKRDEHVENEPPVMKPAASERATPPRNPVEESSDLARSRSSSQEHIYDNLDVFKRTKPVVAPPPTNQDTPASTGSLRARETPLSSTRSRPVTVFIPTSNDNPSTNEFENVFDQFKKRGSIRRAQPSVEKVLAPAPVEEVQPPPSAPEPPKNEPVMPAPKAPSPAPNRRKTVGGVCLTPSNKVATNNDKPAPSWIDIAKEKQNKFQSIANEKDHENVAEQQPLVAVRKATPNVDMRSNRKSMFDPPTNQSNVHALERDSIRALKAGNPNRINNLIQFFDK